MVAERGGPRGTPSMLLGQLLPRGMVRVWLNTVPFSLSISRLRVSVRPVPMGWSSRGCWTDTSNVSPKKLMPVISERLGPIATGQTRPASGPLSGTKKSMLLPKIPARLGVFPVWVWSMTSWVGVRPLDSPLYSSVEMSFTAQRSPFVSKARLSTWTKRCQWNVVPAPSWLSSMILWSEPECCVPLAAAEYLVQSTPIAL